MGSLFSVYDKCTESLIMERFLREAAYMKKLTDIIKENKLDGVVITDGYNIHYNSGYKGHTGCMLITPGNSYILTDSRYTEQVLLEASGYICVDIGMEGYSKVLAKILKQEMPEKNKVVLGFENKSISYMQYKGFLDELNKEFTGEVTLFPLNDMVDNMRMIKTKDELIYIEKAEAIGDEAFEAVCRYVKPGMSEKDVALFLEYTMKKKGADGLSFNTIAASGKNSSLPHAVPTDKLLCPGDFLTMDFGCIYKGYCSDMTRTIHIGKNVDDRMKKIYNIVLEAQLAAINVIKPGVKCSYVDSVARNIIAGYGYGDYFGHGLGHSVGLFIHEEPRCSRKCDVELEAGMTMTVEPGIYIPGEFGVRIEDLVVVTGMGCTNLTHSPKNLICI